MKEYEGQGELFTRPERGWCGGSITDDSRWGAYLGLNTDGGPELYDELLQDACYLWLRDYVDNAKLVEMMMKYNDSPEACLQAIFTEWSDSWGWSEPWDFEEEDLKYIHSLPSYESQAERVWHEEFALGRVGYYLAVPVDYCSSNHGPGTASAHAHLNPLDCNAVWVPDRTCIENMKFPENATHLQKLEVARKYAESVLEEYIKWCNGDCYGCIVEVFDMQGKQVEEDSCWGFIGSEWAEEALESEFFCPTVERYLKGLQ